MIAARQIFLGRGGAKLPYDAEVEYLQSTGAQYIEVGTVIGATSLEIEVAATEIPSSGARKCYGIGYNANFQDDFGVTANGWGGNPSHPCTLGESVIYRADENGTYIDGNKTSSSVYFVTSANNGKKVFLFCGSSGSRAYITGSGNYMSWKGWIASCVIKSGDEKMFDIVPVRFTNELGQSEGAMYDRVSGQLFRNQGTGAFLYGNDK